MCFCVCEWTFECARSVVEITPATMAMYSAKRVAMPELFFVFTCLLVCVIVFVSLCVIVFCVCDVLARVSLCVRACAQLWKLHQRQ